MTIQRYINKPACPLEKVWKLSIRRGHILGVARCQKYLHVLRSALNNDLCKDSWHTLFSYLLLFSLRKPNFWQTSLFCPRGTNSTMSGMFEVVTMYVIARVLLLAMGIILNTTLTFITKSECEASMLARVCVVTHISLQLCWLVWNRLVLLLVFNISVCFFFFNVIVIQKPISISSTCLHSQYINIVINDDSPNWTILWFYSSSHWLTGF